MLLKKKYSKGYIQFMILSNIMEIKKTENYTKYATELEVAMKEEWSQISQSVLHNLLESMSRRIEACIFNNGWPTEYYFKKNKMIVIKK